MGDSFYNNIQIVFLDTRVKGVNEALHADDDKMTEEQMWEITDSVDRILLGFIAVKAYNGPTIMLWEGICRMAQVFAKAENDCNGWAWHLRVRAMGGRAIFRVSIRG